MKKLYRFSIMAAAVGLMTASTALAADNVQEMFSKGSLSGEFRTYYYDRNFDKNTKEREDLASGGILGFKTDALHGLSFGVTFATANDIGSNDNFDVYGLLPKDSQGNHDSVTRLQEAYVQGNWFDTTIKYGGQMLNTPFMNGNDIRLLPKTYKGLSVANKSIQGLDLQAYYITGYMGWADSDYMPVIKSVTSASTDDKPMIIGMAKYTLPIDFMSASVEDWQYHLEDALSMNYFRIALAKKIGNTKVTVEPTYYKEKSIGDKLAGEYDTDQYGVKVGAAMDNGIYVNLFYAKTGDDNLLTPWGDSRIINQQVLASQFANEDSYAAMVGYDFGKLGVTGLSAYLFYGEYNADEVSGKKSTDANEMDYNVQYDFGKNFGGSLNGLSLRARYAVIDNKDTSDYTDTRLYLKYSFAVSGLAAK